VRAEKARTIEIQVCEQVELTTRMERSKEEGREQGTLALERASDLIKLPLSLIELHIATMIQGRPLKASV